MKEYRRRVLFAYASLEGDGDTAEKGAKDLQKKQPRFARKLLDALHGEAWRACQELLNDIDELRKEKGYLLIFRALQSVEKVTVIKKTEAFDQFFEKCHRAKGQPVDAFLRQRRQDWADLLDTTDGTQMSEDLRAYFLLKHVNLSQEDRRQILLANQSNYTLEGIEQALRVSYYDIHEREKGREWTGRRPRNHYHQKQKHYAHAAADEVENEELEDMSLEKDEEEAYLLKNEMESEMPELSDQGASEDDEINDAYTAMDKERRGYKESRKKLSDIQKSRGFFKGDFKGELSFGGGAEGKVKNEVFGMWQGRTLGWRCRMQQELQERPQEVREGQEGKRQRIGQGISGG